MAEQDLLVRILGDDRDLQNALRNTDRSLKRIDDRTKSFGRNIGRAFAAAGITLGTAAVFKGISSSVEAASALNEELSKSQEVFADSSQEIETWSRSTASSFGISQRAALEATGVFGNLFGVVGLLPEQSAAMSKALVELAADLASFNNADPSEVLTAIRSGLIGEAEPLRRYGVLLSEARVQQLALSTTGKDNVKALTDQEKAIARYNIILSDTSSAQGDFARTSDGLANSSRKLRAQLADLSAELGDNLVPALIKVVGAANSVFDTFDRLNSIGGFELNFTDIDSSDLRGLVEARQRIADLKGESDLLVRSLDQVIERLRATSSARPDDRDGARGPGAIDLTNAQVDARNAEQAAAEAKRAAARRQKAFDEFIKGQGLKLDQSALTRNLQDDLAVLRAIEQAVLRRIAEEGRTFKLVEQLARVRLEIQNTTEQAASDATAAGEAAFDATIDALDLNLEIARATQSLEDDQAALRALERAILGRIASEGQNTDLLRQLFDVREEQRRVAEQLADQRRERRQGRQFAALGLTDEGERPTPGVGALQRRLKNLREQIKGTVLDTEKTRRELDRIAAVLSGKFGAVGKEVRDAILEMFNDITSAMEGGGDSKRGPLTKTSGLNTKKILAGLGLSPEEINALRGRLSSINSAGNQLAGLGTPAPARGFGAGAGAALGGPIVVQSTTTINLDGQQVAKVVTKQQQKTKRRNPQQKRGPNRNR